MFRLLVFLFLFAVHAAFSLGQNSRMLLDTLNSCDSRIILLSTSVDGCLYDYDIYYWKNDCLKQLKYKVKGLCCVGLSPAEFTALSNSDSVKISVHFKKYLNSLYLIDVDIPVVLDFSYFLQEAFVSILSSDNPYFRQCVSRRNCPRRGVFSCVAYMSNNGLGSFRLIRESSCVIRSYEPPPNRKKRFSDSICTSHLLTASRPSL